ncbi:hypothetical protein Efla_006916 [Eimeria flavescens]
MTSFCSRPPATHVQERGQVRRSDWLQTVKTPPGKIREFHVERHADTDLKTKFFEYSTDRRPASTGESSAVLILYPSFPSFPPFWIFCLFPSTRQTAACLFLVLCGNAGRSQAAALRRFSPSERPPRVFAPSDSRHLNLRCVDCERCSEARWLLSLNLTGSLLFSCCNWRKVERVGRHSGFAAKQQEVEEAQKGPPRGPCPLKGTRLPVPAAGGSRPSSSFRAAAAAKGQQACLT